ncbi:MAG: DUF805 domain-containing protein [Oscillospiraceae bacterium]|nr:DUF805 domain-containing protein [Oscillospiraceae bacterium]
MKFFGPYINMLKNYVNFKDRTDRRGFWMAILVNAIIGAIIGAIGVEVLTTIYGLAVLLPGIAISVRRLRDAGFPWQNIFFGFIPIAGLIILILKFVKPSAADNGVPVV